MSGVQAQPALTYAQIAHELGCHPSAPARWVLRGVLLSDGTRMKLEAVALPGSWRVTREALDRFLATLTADRMASTPAASAPIKRVRSARSEQVHADLVANGLI